MYKDLRSQILGARGLASAHIYPGSGHPVAARPLTDDEPISRREHEQLASAVVQIADVLLEIQRRYLPDD